MPSKGDESVGRALAKIPSGASIATAAHAGQTATMLASWIQQVAFEPPMICMAVKRGRAIESVIDAAGTFVVNLIGQDNRALFQRFARSPAPGEDPLKGMNVQQRQAGPVLADCIGHLACKVTAKHQAGDHNLYLAEVVAGDAKASAEPYVHVRGTGFSY